ncbi:tRNA (adenosine(37)-N6)-threonylcarbamoyltransferase complex dimerization subunit type 1 TsaB [Nonlabens ulvanivorans]|uniref:N(6)-L-threonylcarbamoyladenine synthase n=1 Tax=Nonlabens ulvanivorans TaxID=906888 RepID=A0A084JUK8_NONUL|nr:tRNA (adenosine(37)-N6)-threonylcarbamoyltransferase complex dimerization subunit type 1 TsaB [Nonlabens ulvanivorans]KEZ92642.1 peptidase M22 [Nonlabens ulvanivorans]PRX15483.1 tRNA threonylcarbamoyladenosine biosynthesis protein TsaB [Nonlabens ulvanivorans]
MALILCVETSSTNCSVALASDDTSITNANSYQVAHCADFIEDNSSSYSHGERLHVFIDDLLKRNNLTVQDIDAIAVSEGPGSYTGLRIGVASVKGMCYALDIPMIAINTLESLSLQNTLPSDYTIAMLDARRMEVYASVYQGKELVETTKAVVLDEDSFSRFRESGNITFIGTGVEKFENLIKEPAHRYVTSNPTAITMCDTAVLKYKKSDTVDVAYFEPFYLKEFKAG